MKKLSLFLFFSSVLNFVISEAVSSLIKLSENSVKSLMTEYDLSENSKEIFNKWIKTTQINSTTFDLSGRVIKDKDYSNMCLKGFNYSKCNLCKVNFENADLTETDFTGATFKKIKFNGAFFYQGFKFNEKTSPIKAVKYYSDLMNQARESKANGLVKESNQFYRNAFLLTRFFKSLSLDLRGANLRNLNLTDIDLENADLTDAQLQGVWLSESVRIPNYNHPNELFRLWKDAEGEVKILYQKLVNARFNIFQDLSADELRQVDWKNTDLRNSNLSNTTLDYINFSGCNLERAYLDKCKFNGCDLIKTNFKNASLKDISISRCFLISYVIRGTCFTGANLENAHLEGLNFVENQCNKVNFTGANLIGASFRDVNLVKANFKEANLQRASLINVDLQQANFDYANLDSTSFEGVNLIGINLDSTSSKARFLNIIKKEAKNQIIFFGFIVGTTVGLTIIIDLIRHNNTGIPYEVLTFLN